MPTAHHRQFERVICRHRAAVHQFLSAHEVGRSCGVPTRRMCRKSAGLDVGELLVGRYYDPATGQFLSVDPLVDETGQPYAYTGDDPINALDPSGLGLIPSWVSSAADSIGHGVISVGECLENYDCLSPEGLANAGAGFADQAAQLLDGLICTGTSEQTCPTWSVGAPYPCGPQGSYQVGEAAFFGVGFAIPGGDESDAAVDISRAATAESTSPEAVDEILSEVRSGRTPPNLEVDTVADLDQLYNELASGGTPIDSSYPGKMVELENGTRIGIRQVSQSGGPTIDIFKPDGTYIKVHLP
jgi:hypothetical protein